MERILGRPKEFNILSIPNNGVTHLYVISVEDCIHLNDFCVCLDEKGENLVVREALDFMPSEAKKIIATTDMSLGRYIENSRGEGVFEHLPQLPESYVKEYNKKPTDTLKLAYKLVCACTCNTLDCPMSYWNGIDYSCNARHENGEFYKEELEVDENYNVVVV